MTKISNKNAYKSDIEISELDYVIGTDGDNLGKITKTYNIGVLRKFILAGLSPLIGGTLRFTQITYNGVDYANASEVLNSLNPSFTVDQYHIVVVSVNGVLSMLKLQDITVGDGGTVVSQANFIIFPVSVGPKGDDGIGIVSIDKTDTTGLVDTYTITYSDATTSSYTVTNGSKGDKGDKGEDASIVNLQKTITYPTDFTGTSYTLQLEDNNRLIFISNGANDVSVIIPTGLSYAFFSALLQKGTGVVTISGTGTTIIPSIGNKIEGQNFQVALDKIENTEIFHLTGNNKV